jgi:hypothetical protein
VELGLANSLFNHLTISLINMNLENPLHLLYITIPFDLPNMTIGFRQLVDRVSGRRTMRSLCNELWILFSRKELFAHPE